MTIIRISSGTETIWHFFCCVEAPQVMKRCTQPTFNLLLCQKSSACFDMKPWCRGLNEVNSPRWPGNAVRCHVSIPDDPHTLCREMFVHKVVVVTLILWDWGLWIQLIKIKWYFFFSGIHVYKWMTVSHTPVRSSLGRSSTGLEESLLPGLISFVFRKYWHTLQKCLSYLVFLACFLSEYLKKS